MKEELQKRLSCNIFKILEQVRIRLRYKKEYLWRGWYSKVLTLTHLRNVLLTPSSERRDGMQPPLTWSSALCRIGSSPTTSSMLSQIRQAREYKIIFSAPPHVSNGSSWLVGVQAGGCPHIASRNPMIRRLRFAGIDYDHCPTGSSSTVHVSNAWSQHSTPSKHHLRSKTKASVTVAHR